MTTLAAPLARTLTRVERAAEDATTASVLTSGVGRLLADAIEADAFVFLRLDPLTSLWLDASGEGYDAGSCERFSSHVFLRSPLTDYGHVSRLDERVLRVSRSTTSPDDAWVRYSQGELGFHEDLSVSFAVGGFGYGHLMLGRRDGTYSAAAVRLVESAVPAVTAALKRLLARETLDAAPGERVALLFVEADGAVIPANAAGTELLEGWLQVDPARTRTSLAAMVELARRDLQEPAEAPLPRVLYVDPRTRRRFRLATERMTPLPGSPPRALLMAEPVRALDSVELLRTAGLSEREAEVALVTLRGLRSAEGATALAMSEHTFLSHLKTVYRKLGVGSRSELASLLLGGI